MKIALGITGSIAAYKSIELIRLFQKRGDSVYPILTKNGANFITDLTLSSISGNKTVTDMFDVSEKWDVKHISLAREVDVLLISPATANIMAKFSCGIADDFLSTFYLSFEKPVVIAPAMNRSMWKHPATLKNVKVLEERGNIIVYPHSGYLACREEGEGRLAPLEEILNFTYYSLTEKDFSGKKIVVTAGATQEFLDPVRYLTNRSTGKMGVAIAREFWLRGGDVVLIKGKGSVDVSFPVRIIEVESAKNMYDVVFKEFKDCDICVMAAAVSDYSPEKISGEKIKKRDENLILKLKRNVDILAEIGKIKNKNQILVGFAAETENIRENSIKKLKAKNLDFIVSNDVSKGDIGFNSDYNEISIFFENGREKFYKRDKKEVIARHIVNEIIEIGEKNE